MAVTSIVGADGSVRLTLDGHEIKLREAGIEAARNSVIERTLGYAATTGIIQVLHAIDPDGEWVMYIYPSGEIVPAPPAAAPQVPPPAMPIRPPSATPPAPLAVELQPAVELPAVDVPAPIGTADEAPALPTPPSQPDDDDIEHTVLIRRRARPSIGIHLHTGETVTAIAPVLLGRRPAPRPGHSTVTLSSPGLEVSRTHALLDVDDLGRVFVVDQDSANGTYIDGEPATPGTPTVVPSRARLELGDVVLTIDPPHATAATGSRGL